MIEILAIGPFATIQDLGRPGLAALGVPRSGAFDRAALALANRLVGNDPDCAGLEVTMGALALRAHDAVTIAMTGAACSGIDWGRATTLPAGGTIRLGVPQRGVRTYLAVRGGLAVPAQLGSRSTDVLSGVGPPVVRPGDQLAIGNVTAGPVLGSDAAYRDAELRLRITLGPRDTWFTAESITSLTASSWTVRNESDRVGIRLDGPRLTRAITTELPSEPTRPGAVQVAADGRPILFGPDAPVTGGYPVIAVLDAASLDVAAQLRPGQTLRFALNVAGL